MSINYQVTLRQVYLIFIIIFLLTITGSGQEKFTQVIRGTVVDNATSLPLPGANVVLLDLEPLRGTVTDDRGAFRLEGVPAGRQSLKVSYMGYKEKILSNLNVTTGKELVLTIGLDELVMVMDELVVRPEDRNDLPINEMALVSARSFTIEETERFAGSVGDPARMASAFAGVSTMSDQQNEIVIRGNSPMGLQWRLDGVDIPNPNHFGAVGTTGGGISMINNNTLSNSDFFTGGFPAEYGNALTGVFDLKMRPGNNEKWEFVVQTGFNGLEAGAEGPITRKTGSSFLFNYRYSMLLLVDKIIGTEALSVSDIPFYHDLSFKFNFPNKKFGRFSITGLGGINGIEELDSDADTSEWSGDYMGSDYYFGTRMGTLIASHLYYFDPKTWIDSYISLSGVNSYADEDTLTVDNTDPAPQTRQDAWESRLQFNVIFHEKPGLKTLIEAGVNAQVLFYRFMEKEWQDDSGLIPLIQVDGTSASFKAFVQYQRKFSDSFTFDAGLNALCFAYNGKFSLDPRVSARWQINGSHSVSAGTGVFSQLPEDMFYFVETELEDGTVIHTNKEMGYMRSFHFVLGYDYLIAENLRLKTEAYYQHLFNIPVRETEPAYSMLNFGDDSFSSIPIIDSLVNQGTGNNLGIELTVEKFLARGYYFLFTGALFSSRYKGYDGITRHTAFDKNFTLNLLGGKEFCIRKKNFLNIDLKLTWAGGMRYVPFHTQQVSEHYYIRIDDWENAYEERRPDYFRLNIRLSYRINLRRATFEIALDMLNVTNQKNIYFEFFDPSTGEIQTVYQLPFIPVPLIRLQF